MIEEILSVLKKYQGPALDGFFIAKIQKNEQKNEQLGIQFKKVSTTIESAVITELLPDNQTITFFLIKSKINKIVKKKEIIIIPNSLFKIYITKAKINQFLAKTGDKNPIHYTAKPVVPGLLILEELLKNIDFKIDSFSIKFINPLIIETELKIAQSSDNELVGCTINEVIFTMKFKN